MKGKKSFAVDLQYSVDQQDETLKERFAVADSVLMSAPEKVLKNKVRTTSENKLKQIKDYDNGLVIRDTFSLPANDHTLIEILKTRALRQQQLATKSEVVRAGLLALNSLSDKELRDALQMVVRIKTGRKPL